MNKLNNLKTLAAIFAVLLVFASIDAFAQKSYTVEQGTRIRVRMNDTLSSKTARTGDRFQTTVTEAVYANNGVVVIPTGSTITGRVDSIRKAKRGGDPGTIDVSFTEVRLPNGTRRSINGSLTGLNTKDAKSDNEGTASGDDRKNDKIIFIGGGAAGGALIGAIAGGGKGALIGSIIGGLAGLGGERLTKGEDAEVKSGTEFGVYLNRSVSMPRFGSVGGDDDYDNRRNNDNRRYNDNRGTSGRTYTVRPGDTLGKISQRFYGTTQRYMDIYEANRNVLSSPSRVEIGQVLVIP